VFGKSSGPTVFGNSSGPDFIWEYQWPSLYARPFHLCEFETLKLFGNSSGPVRNWNPGGQVYVWDIQGPSLCLGLPPEARVMVGSARGPIYV
jgi:hypothetical protein